RLGCLVDRAYCPWVDMESLLRAHDLPLVSVEQRRPLGEFDVLAFTLRHETSYTNVLTMLDLAGVPLRSPDRDKGQTPLVIAGGHGALVPEPLSPFIDLFGIGEAEVLLPPLLEVLTGTKGERRSSRLAACAKLRGIYVPSLYATDGGGQPIPNGAFPFPVERRILKNLDDSPIPEDIAVPSVSIVHDRAALELFRGCTRGCRFCQAGMICRPVRERSVEAVMETVPRLLGQSGYDELGLLSLASCDYSGIERLIDGLTGPLTEHKARLSLPSLRMDGFSVGLAGRLQKLRRGGLTFAPEAGTQRLRDVINKGVNEEAIESCLTKAFSLGWDRVKLYFMMGLPTETEEDLNGITALARRALKLGRSLGRRRTTVSVSVAGFVPKAHTPFQWERQNSIEELREKGRYLKSQIRERSIALSYHEPEQTFLEGVLSRGDRRTADVIERAWRTGARFDSWTETFNLQNWLNAFDFCGLDPLSFTRERDESERLSWDHISPGVTREFLLRERHKAYAVEGAELTPDCRSGHCAGCGLNCFARGENPDRSQPGMALLSGDAPAEGHRELRA
ncbi:MAG: TIGR03960 family B12-binding radical SAM protein, partial [Fretibacterium sp.]|nr:TIGR03960 family B12-binding radical SAM protein [Fretibacterium sp.]